MNSRVLVLAGALLCAVIGGYAWWWNSTLKAIADGYDPLFTRLLPPGSELSYGFEDSGGFPFRVNHRLRDVEIIVPDYGTVTFELLELIHQPWSNDHLMMHFAGQVTRRDVAGDTVWSLSAVKNLASLTGYASGRLSYNLDMRDISLQTPGGDQIVPALQFYARTDGFFGDDATESQVVTDLGGLPDLF